MAEVTDLSSLAARLGYEFHRPELLELAVTHRSWCAENGDVPSNERLEFLGDSVLGAVVTDHLYERYPELSEGRLSKLRAALVSEPALAVAARSLDLGDMLRLSKGEDMMGGRNKDSILSDAFEAVVGAAFLDSGWPEVTALVLRVLGDRVGDIAYADASDPDYKGRLQELVARHFETPPIYELRDVGPDHAKEFFAQVLVAGDVAGQGEGGSKKKAEQAAAERAWRELVQQLEGRDVAADDTDTTKSSPPSQDS